MVGKAPHRPEGKTPYAEKMGAATSHPLERGDPLREKDAGLAEPGQYPAEEPIGGSRPGVESRVREAIEGREAREDKARRAKK